jgi:hypothetical protein
MQQVTAVNRVRYPKMSMSEGLQSSLFFESPEEIFARVFRELKPRTPVPDLRVDFCQFANADSFIRLNDGRLHVRMSDLLSGAPAPVLEALAHILLGKLYRRPIARQYNHRYRLYLNRKDVRRQAQIVRQARGRKFISGPQGEHYNLDQIFERLNAAHFDGLLGRPELGWSRRRARHMLGHFDPAHNAIILSRILDQKTVPEIAVEYVMFHEMLHLRHPVEHNGARRCVHTKEFRADEKQFPRLKEAKEFLKRL